MIALFGFAFVALDICAARFSDSVSVRSILCLEALLSLLLLRKLKVDFDLGRVSFMSAMCMRER